jgi:alkanesulfonate monooxygenase SsuD/methylene tetrahydromethanopterin reductase-like flavin-dependent oxidoreductase (luciferase family)
MSQIGFGWFFPNGPESPQQRGTFVADCDRSLSLIRGHFTSAWMADHLQFKDSDILEGWTTLTYFAARHPDLRFGHGVLCQSFRNPALLAKMAATFQFLSGGRLIVGLGAGWHEPEYEAYNFPFPSAGARVAELGEVVAICKALWTQPEATVIGDHYQARGAVCEPRPDPLPPLMIGGWRPRILRLIAREADWWDVSGFGGVPRADYPALAAEMDRACAEVGRDPATLRRTFSCVCAVAATEAGVAALTEEARPGFGLAGTPPQVVEQIRGFQAQGVTHMQLAFADFPATGSLELFLSDVLPAFAES